MAERGHGVERAAGRRDGGAAAQQAACQTAVDGLGRHLAPQGGQCQDRRGHVLGKHHLRIAHESGTKGMRKLNVSIYMGVRAVA